MSTVIIHVKSHCYC